MIKASLFAVFLASMPAVPARAFVRAGVKQTLGSQKYAGTCFFGDIGRDFHVRPSYNQYRSDVSSGTYKTIAVRLGYDQDSWGVGFTGGGSPKVNNYSNRFFGVDGVFSFSPGSGGPRRRLVNVREGEGPAGGESGRNYVSLGATLRF